VLELRGKLDGCVTYEKASEMTKELHEVTPHNLT
jgi:hypothetical protein